MRAVLLAGLVLTAAATETLAAYVFYFRSYGDWSIVCWREVVDDGSKRCRFSAPSASLDHTTRQNVILVHEYAPEQFQIAIEVRDDVIPDLPAFLRVDGQNVHETNVDAGLARWIGADATSILNEMVAGSRLVYRVQTAPDGLPHDTQIGLDGFGDALNNYRQLLRAHEMIGATALPGPQPTGQDGNQ